MSADTFLVMSSVNIDVKLSLPVFDGSGYAQWKRKFMAYARIKRFASALIDDSKLPASADMEFQLDKTKANDKEQIDAVHANELAVACLQLSLDCESANRCLTRTESQAYPNGRAKQTIENLDKNYLPTDTIAMATLRTRLKNLSMNENDDPKSLFEEIYEIESQWRTSVGPKEALSDNELKSAVMMASPSIYTTEL